MSVRPIRDTARLRLLKQQDRLRQQIARNVADPAEPAASSGAPPAARRIRGKRPPPGAAPAARPAPRAATAADLAAARRELGPAVGLRPFVDFVRREYGSVDDATAREFLRGSDAMQVFSAPPKAEGRAATTGRTDDWLLT